MADTSPLGVTQKLEFYNQVSPSLLDAQQRGVGVRRFCLSEEDDGAVGGGGGGGGGGWWGGAQAFAQEAGQVPSLVSSSSDGTPC